MTSSNSTSPPAVLLDTCVISGIVRGDIRSDDSAALIRMADMVATSSLTMLVSAVAREEIDRIPESFRKGHLNQYNALKQIRSSNATWLNMNPAWDSLSPVVHHPDYVKLRGILKDENDARMVFQGKAAGVTDFVTVDYKSILNKTSELARLGVRALSPAQYMSLSSTTAQSCLRSNKRLLLAGRKRLSRRGVCLNLVCGGLGTPRSRSAGR